jgi:hypothetical protein
MKKHLFLSLFIILISSVQAQKELDSLRLVLPELTAADTFGLSKTGKYIWIIDDPNVYILDSKSRKVVRSYYSQSGNVAQVDFNFSDEYVLISYAWLYECHIYSLKSGKKIRSVNLGYHNTFSSFINMSNSFIYSPSFAYDENHSFIIENLDDLSYKDSISIILNQNSFDGVHNPSFDGNSIKYLDKTGKISYFDVSEYVNKKSNFIYEEQKIENRHSLPDISLFTINKLKWRPLLSIDYSNEERKISFAGSRPRSLTQIFLSPELNLKSDSVFYQNKFWWGSEMHEKKIINDGGLRLYFVFMGGLDSLDLNLPSSIKYLRDSIEVEFNINEVESICRNGDFFALSKYNTLDSCTTVLIFEQTEIHSGIIRNVNQIKKRIDHLCYVDQNGESFIYKSPGLSSLSHRISYYNSTLNRIADSELSMEIIDSLIYGNDDYDYHVVDSCHLLLVSRYFSQIKLEETNIYVLDIGSKTLEKVNLNTVTPIATLSVISLLNAIVLVDLNNLICFRSLSDFSVELYIHLFENNNWLVKLPNSPFYMCSKDASKMLHYVTPSLKVIGFEQLDPVYNRPDIVLDSIGKYFGGTDAELVANYRESWEKRIDRLGLDKEKLGKGEIAVPDAEIVGADTIAYENNEGKLAINVKANDPKYTLRRFNIYVNEVPLYGSAGISIAQLKKQQWDTTLSVPLSLGENKIQVSVMNELGLENFKYPTYVNYTPVNNTIVAKTHYIGIGVNHFKDQNHDLKFCVDDVTDLAQAFNGKNTVTKLFTDQKVTRENILTLKQYLQDSTTVNDKVIISCSSHGLLDDSLNFYLATHDVDFKNPKARGLKYEELEGLLDGIPARQKLLLLDACNSGENDKTEVLKKELEEKMTRMDSTQVLAARGAIIRLEQENKSNFKKMNELFVNVRNNTGSVIISAAGGQESALEAIEVNGQKIENGAFTYSVLEYLKAHEGKTDALTVNKLKQYVEQRVEEITNGKQKPTSRQETMEVDWKVR